MLCDEGDGGKKDVAVGGEGGTNGQGLGYQHGSSLLIITNIP